MSAMRKEELWSQETNEEWTQEWRDDLTAEELDYIAGLDRDYQRGVMAICSAILVREKVRIQFAPQEIAELQTVYDHCWLRLRDGRTMLARLASDGTLQLDELSAVC